MRDIKVDEAKRSPNGRECRENEGDVKLSRGGCVLNEPHSETTTVAQSALDTVNQMTTCPVKLRMT
jgi:hypothetical protein